VDGAWDRVAINDGDAFPGTAGLRAELHPHHRALSDAPRLRPQLRIIHSDGIRWTDQTLGARTTVSHEFTARPRNDDPVCPP
jgi:hypothetical protein